MTPADFGDFVKFLRERSGISLEASKPGPIDTRMAPILKEMKLADLAALVAGLKAGKKDLSEAIVDAAGEMANILAGNLESVGPQPSRLGLPSTISGSSLLETSEFSNENRQIVSFIWNHTPISVRIGPNTGTGGA